MEFLLLIANHSKAREWGKTQRGGDQLGSQSLPQVTVYKAYDNEQNKGIFTIVKMPYQERIRHNVEVKRQRSLDYKFVYFMNSKSIATK